MLQEEQLQSEIEFLQRALEGEVENTTEALREAQVAPVTTNELRAVSAELKQQWLSASQSQSAHNLMASLGSGSGDAAPDVEVIHDDTVGDTSDTATAAPTPPPKFQRRTGSLRDKLRGTVSEARVEARYFS